MVSISENANKLAYLANENPGIKLPELIAMFQLPGADVNAALWRAEDMGYIEVEKIADKDLQEGRFGMVTVKEIPSFTFGEEVQRIQELLRYCVKKVGLNQQDMEENQLVPWFIGYPGHNFTIALKECLKDGSLVSYTVRDTSDKDGESLYTFYTLPENLEHHWGLKNFKDPKKAEVL